MPQRWTAAVCKQGHVISRDVSNPTQRLELPRRVVRPSASAAGRRSAPYAGVEVARFCGLCSAPVLTVCD